MVVREDKLLLLKLFDQHFNRSGWNPAAPRTFIRRHDKLKAELDGSLLRVHSARSNQRP